MKTTKTIKTVGNALLSLVVFGAFNYVIFNTDVLEQLSLTANTDSSAIEQIDRIAEEVELGDGTAIVNEKEDVSDKLIPAKVIKDAIVKANDDVQAEAAVEESAETTYAAYTAPSTYYNTINVNGTVMGVVDSYNTTTAPAQGAGLWKGSLSTTDGSWAYIIGHNPGSFECVANLYNGAPITVWDANGASRTYTVFSVFDISSSTYWEELAPQVTGYGESLILQTCLPGSMYRIVLAA